MAAPGAKRTFAKPRTSAKCTHQNVWFGRYAASDPCVGFPSLVERRKRWICLRAFDFTARSNLTRPPNWPAHTPADLLSELSGTNLIIDGALTEAARREQRKVRCRVTRRLAPATVHTVSVAGSLIASRSQFAHAAYKTPHFEIFEWFFSQCAIWNKFVLDRIALSGEPSN